MLRNEETLMKLEINKEIFPVSVERLESGLMLSIEGEYYELRKLSSEEAFYQDIIEGKTKVEITEVQWPQPNGIYCRYCGKAKSVERIGEIILCADCSETFGHDLFTDL